jgi:hypothetical protein
VAPAQLCRQCRHNSRIGHGETDRPTVRFTPPPPVPLCQPPAASARPAVIRGPLPAEHLSRALADAPVQHHEFAVDCCRWRRAPSIRWRRRRGVAICWDYGFWSRPVGCPSR